MREPQFTAEDLSDLEQVKATDAYKVLSELLTDEQILFVWRKVGPDNGRFCGSCWNEGPYCCYDSVNYD